MYLFIVAIDIVPMWWKNALIIGEKKKKECLLKNWDFAKNWRKNYWMILAIMWFQKSLYYAKGKTKEMEKKMKLNNRLKINTEREEINLDDFNENRIEIVGNNILSKQNIITNSNKIIKKNDDKNELNTRNGFNIDKIKEVSFGDRLLSKLFDIYPQ